MTGELRILSVYEGFFTGGARILHSRVIAALQRRRTQNHSVLSIHREMHRESLRQTIRRDASYKLLRAAGVSVAALDRVARDPSLVDLSTMDGQADLPEFSPRDLAITARHLAQAEIVVALKEQPLRLLTQPGMPRRPIVVCLHRSDPQNHPTGVANLLAAIDDGRVVAAICCAESTRAAYAAAGVPMDLLHVIPNGADRKRFRPAGAFTRARLRSSLGLPLQSRVVVFAARFDGMKNVPLFLESAHELLRRDPSTAVVACGAGMSRANPALNALLRQIFGTDRTLIDRLRLLGVRQDMEDVYRAADVVALTSSVGEAAPLCLIEGMLCGAVPVATAVGDCASIVEGRGLTAPADPVAIASAWIEAFDLRERLLADLPGVAERFSQRRMVAGYADIFSRLRKSTALRALTPALAAAPA